jgi:hypothetical protein
MMFSCTYIIVQNGDDCQAIAGGFGTECRPMLFMSCTRPNICLIVELIIINYSCRGKFYLMHLFL